jgi:hypothetical protein
MTRDEQITQNLTELLTFYQRLAQQDPRSGLVAYAAKRVPVLEARLRERT